MVGAAEPLADEGEHLGEFGGVGEIEVHQGSWHRVFLGWCSAGGRADGLLGVLLLAGVGEAIGDGAGLDDLPGGRQAVALATVVSAAASRFFSR